MKLRSYFQKNKIYENAIEAQDGLFQILNRVPSELILDYLKNKNKEESVLENQKNQLYEMQRLISTSMISESDIGVEFVIEKGDYFAHGSIDDLRDCLKKALEIGNRYSFLMKNNSPNNVELHDNLDYSKTIETKMIIEILDNLVIVN